jgi:hypothetical protein
MEFFLSNQLDAVIVLILICYKTLHVSDIFSAHHQEFSAVHSALVSFMQGFDDRFQTESGWKSITMHGNMNVKSDASCNFIVILDVFKSRLTVMTIYCINHK